MKNIVALIVMVLCAGCCTMQQRVWLSPTCIEMSTDDIGTIFFVQFKNQTNEEISIESADIDTALKFGVYKSATSSQSLGIECFDDDVMYEVYSEQYNLSPMASIDYVTEIPMRINGIEAGENVELAIDCEIMVLVSGVQRPRRLRCNRFVKVIPRDEILGKIFRLRHRAKGSSRPRQASGRFPTTARTGRSCGREGRSPLRPTSSCPTIAWAAE